MNQIEKRLERKFVLSPLEAEVFLESLYQSDCLIHEPYPKRQVNNVYLDTLDSTFYYIHQQGLSSRDKFRIRWYGASLSFLESPNIEKKSKTGVVTHKQKWEFPDCALVEVFCPDERAKLARRIADPVREKFKELRPQIVNSYERRYFFLPKLNARLTMDKNILYYRDEHVKPEFSYRETERILFELKTPAEAYNQNSAEDWEKFFKAIPWRATKNSKYISGRNLLGG